ncbi:MAG: hypothetical protein RL177_1524 [Bacteroidota bacterium]|jgi:ABC-type lipoprotein release transport system permease subunit
MSLIPILRLSWKNVWRNPVRSGVVVASVITGIWGGLFMAAFMNGLTQSYIQNQLKNYSAHIRIQDRDYDTDPLPIHWLVNADATADSLRSEPYVTALTTRSVVQGLASSATSNFGVTVYGVEVDTEPSVSTLASYLVEGDYLPDATSNAVVVGTKLAKRLGVRLGSRIVLNVQDVNGTLTAGAFRITGLYHSPNSGYDERTVFVRKADLNRFLLAEGISHELVMLVDDYRMADTYVQRLRADTSVVVKSWGDLSPAMRYSEASLGTVLVIFMGIILMALTFGIVNTMLMAVLERTAELGMMKAIGVDNARTAAMILFETVFLTLVGAPIGLLLSWGTIQLTAQSGIDLGAFASGLEMYGMSPVVIPELSATYYAAITTMMVVATLVAALFPCLKALKLNPVQAIRSI